MKSSSLFAAAFVLAAISGTAGYFIGKGRSPSGLPDGAITGPVTRTISNKANDRKVMKPVDPNAIRVALDAEKNPLARFRLALENLEGWVAANPAGALDWLQSQPATDRRDDVIRMALKQFAEMDAKGAADWAMKHLKGRDLNNAIVTLAEDWAEQDGAGAAAWFGALPPSPERDAAMETIFFGWASNDPSAAIAFLNVHPQLSDLAPILSRAAFAGWAKSDPVAAVSASLASSRADQDPARFANTVANWATVDLESSSQWLLDKVPAGAERQAAAGELGVIFAQQSPEAGIAWLGKLNAGAERDAAASSLAATWSNAAPADAAKWASNQNLATLAPAAISEIAENFLMKDQAAFQAWRAGLPEGPLKEQVAKMGAQSAAEDDE